ncbi:MAG: 30S ribosomal protein S14 [Legionellales bacterium]|nr:30S ribosomal protein S14 [Legionellales bacterium]|tara:strand:+ start:6657 stop:6995 length:339 start_codon:yes stop_codon:yes gene_type:complete
MAKQSIIEREKKRTKLVNKYAPKRDAIRTELKSLYAKLNNDNEDFDTIVARIDELQTALDKMPNNASPKRQRNRCRLTGRPRGVYRKFQLSRSMLRKYAMMGFIPGLVKSSW